MPSPYYFRSISIYIYIYNNIIIIEQLKSGNLNTAQKKEFLKKREKFFQAKLKTLAPHGLNARLG